MRQYHEDSLVNTRQTNDNILQIIGRQLADLAKRSIGLSRSERILGGLRFEEVQQREHGIEVAEIGTYSWAFGSWAVEDHGVDYHFVNWLKRKASDSFMVTGKPGSGKSTFMKFVAHHNETRKSLESWSGGQDLVIASFYFWSSGTLMQRSTRGLLQSLLYQILCQAPGKIPQVAGNRWDDVANQKHAYRPWTAEEISDALKLAVNEDNASSNFCFFIDGLDEYEGADYELVRQLKILSSSSRVKLCLSSRPRNVFQQHFPSQGSNHLRLQDHTREDIWRVVNTYFQRFNGLIDIQQPQLTTLQEAVVGRSEGVFLWVLLVLRELIEGMEPPFTGPELLERLSIMPPTLDAYFQRMLDRLHVQHRRFAARLLLMSTHVGYALNLELVHYLWHNEQRQKVSYTTITDGEQHWDSFFSHWESEIALRIRKSCGDFLHVAYSRNGGKCAEHTHKAVFDFLDLQRVKAQLFILADWHDAADVHLEFCRIYLLWATEAAPYRSQHVAVFMTHARQYESYSGKACPDLVRDFSKACALGFRSSSSRWAHEMQLKGFKCEPRDWSPNMQLERFSWQPLKTLASLSYACRFGLHRFVGHDLREMTPERATLVAQFLLQAYVLQDYQIEHEAYVAPAPVLVILCQHGACVNRTVQHFYCKRHQGNTSEWTMSSIRTPGPLYLDPGADFQEPGTSDQRHALTVWEKILQGLPWTLQNANVLVAAHMVLIIEALLDIGASLDCKLPDHCSGLEKAIFGPFERQKKNWGMSRLRTALLKRGYMFDQPR